MKYQHFPGLQSSFFYIKLILLAYTLLFLSFHVDICFSSTSGIQNLFMRCKHIFSDVFDVNNDNEKSERKNNKIQ